MHVLVHACFAAGSDGVPAGYDAWDEAQAAIERFVHAKVMHAQQYSASFCCVGRSRFGVAVQLIPSCNLALWVLHAC